jgi:glycerol-3-phosphate dehydrogenase (NAD(P)+)
MNITILGAGAWGSTLAHLALACGHRVTQWSRRESLATAVQGAELIVSAISMKGVPQVVEQLRAIALPPPTILITATKGLSATDIQATNQGLPALPSQLWQAAFPERAVVVLSGPNLSQEIQAGLPAATVVASADIAAATLVQQAFSSSAFRVYTNPDALGVELGGTLKNVIAIAVGACDGLNLGTNAKAALVTRGLTEIIRIGQYWGAQPDTFYGLSGLGDLLATCNSALSRNYQVGHGLAQGRSLEAVLATLAGTAEGVNTTRVLIKLAHQQHISLPITQQVNGLLSGQITPQDALAALMLRDSKPEVLPISPFGVEPNSP